MVFFQRLEDCVVPPSQGLIMVEALRAQRVPVVFAFKGQGHGLRQRVTISACLRAEQAFYGLVFGFQVPG